MLMYRLKELALLPRMALPTGYLLVDKPAGITSFDVVKEIRRVFKTETVGHIGTLDPFATGLILILVNRQATKLATDLVHLTKTYHAEITFGFETDTLDITGKKVKHNSPEELNQFCQIDIKTILNSFIGDYIQVTPMYSAVKYKGEHLYEIARNNKTAPLVQPRRIVNIYSIDLLNLINNPPTFPQITINTRVSSGTYIRVLATDIAQKMHLFATVTKLQRTQLGEFSIREAKKLSKIDKNDIIPITNLTDLIKRLQNGIIV